MKDFCFEEEEEERKGREVKERNCGIWAKFFLFFWNMKLFLFSQFPDGLLYLFRDMEMNLSVWRKEWFSSWNKNCCWMVEWGGAQRIMNCSNEIKFSADIQAIQLITQLLLARFHFPPLSDSPAVPLNLSRLSTKFPWWLFFLLSSVNTAANQYCKWNFMFRNYWTSMYESA